MRLFNGRFIPLFVVRWRNRIVDRKIERDFRDMPPQKFHDSLDERGFLKMEVPYGPEYPPCLHDLQETYRKFSAELTKDLVRECAKDIDGYRGLINEGKDGNLTFEFFFPRGEVYVVFGERGTVSVRMTLQATFFREGYEVVSALLRNIEDRVFATPLAAE